MFEKHRKGGHDCFIIVIILSTDLLIDSLLTADTCELRNFGVDAETG